MRTGFVEADYDQAVRAIHDYYWNNPQPEAPPKPKRTYKVPPRGGVYVIGFGPYVKIGVTENYDEREVGLQTPEKVKLYALFPEARASYEKLLHCRYEKYRLNGEWFRKEGTLAEWIDGGCK